MTGDQEGNSIPTHRAPDRPHGPGFANLFGDIGIRCCSAKRYTKQSDADGGAAAAAAPALQPEPEPAPFLNTKKTDGAP